MHASTQRGILSNFRLKICSSCRLSDRKRKFCGSPRAQNSEGEASEPEENLISSQPLDWRKFRADLVAAERLQEKVDTKSSVDTSAESSQRDSASNSPSEKQHQKDVWAHEISAPEAGCILLAKSSIGNIGFFRNSVIFLTEHENSHGSCGLLLGRESTSQDNPLAQVLSMLSAVKCGGPVSRGSIQILHKPPAMSQSQEILEGIYLGGMSEFKEALRTDLEKLPEMAIFHGCCRWGPYQIISEEGIWVYVSASPALLQELLYGDFGEDDIRARLRELTEVKDI